MEAGRIKNPLTLKMKGMNTLKVMDSDYIYPNRAVTFFNKNPPAFLSQIILIYKHNSSPVGRYHPVKCLSVVVMMEFCP